MTGGRKKKERKTKQNKTKQNKKPLSRLLHDQFI